jgi:hypothetical protein
VQFVDAVVLTSTLHLEGFVISVAQHVQLEMGVMVEVGWVVDVDRGMGLLMLVARGDVALVDLLAFLAPMTGIVESKISYLLVCLNCSVSNI